jgi:hypothetical protein
VGAEKTSGYNEREVMEIGTYVCGSCAATGISSLSIHSGAEEAMKEFCRKSLKPLNNPLYAFYVFVAGPEVPGHGHSSRSWPRYGTEFAKYIKDNKLGTVRTLGPKINVKFHPTTKCQIWIWSPNQENIIAWWQLRSQGAVRKSFV